MAMRASATSRCLDRGDTVNHLLIEAAIGEGASIEFLSYLANADLPDPMDVLVNGWKIDTDRLDRSMAVSTGFTALVLGTRDAAEQTKLATLAWLRYAEYLKAGMADIVMEHMDALVADDLGYASKNLKLKDAAEKVIFELGKSPVSRYAKG